ncbi:MAG TPA: hypothetical protein VF472_16350 [Burkholderiaceae bacterium]
MKSSERTAVQEKAAFTERLKTAIRSFDENLLSPTTLAREFNRRSKSSTVAVTGAHKWLTGESIPQQQKMVVLASWLGVSVQWLRYGVSGESPVPSDKDQKRQKKLVNNFTSLSDRDKAIVEKLIDEMLRHN